jgi:hypothetical protein
VPAAKSCAITNVEICRNFYINLLVTDVILLIIMLTGLLRLRRGAGGSFYLSQLLWKQVGHCRFLLVVMSLSHFIQNSSGCHLARYCHRRRTPTSGKPGQLIIVHPVFLYLSPLYTVVAPFFEYKR